MIVLIRHATPIIDYGVCSYGTFKKRKRDYDTTMEVDIREIDAFKGSEFYLQVKSVICHDNTQIYCSTLGRAKSTCRALFADIDNIDAKIIFDERLKEVDLNIFRIPLLYCKVRTWFFIFRILSLMKFGALKEIKNTGQKIHEDLIGDRSVVIVSHGLILSSLKKHLDSRGYLKQKSYKNGCLTVELWEI